MTTTARIFLDACRTEAGMWRDKIPHILNQLDESQVWWRPREEMNSIGNLILHLCGNMTQWILAGVGEEPDRRDRPREFSERGPISKAELLRKFDDVTSRIDALLADLPGEALAQPRVVQGSPETKLSALFLSLAHLHGHGQEIICLARLQLGDAYRFHLVIE